MAAIVDRRPDRVDDDHVFGSPPAGRIVREDPVAEQLRARRHGRGAAEAGTGRNDPGDVSSVGGRFALLRAPVHRPTRRGIGIGNKAAQERDGVPECGVGVVDTRVEDADPHALALGDAVHGGDDTLLGVVVEHRAVCVRGVLRCGPARGVRRRVPAAATVAGDVVLRNRHHPDLRVACFEGKSRLRRHRDDGWTVREPLREDLEVVVADQAGDPARRRHSDRSGRLKPPGNGEGLGRAEAAEPLLHLSRERDAGLVLEDRRLHGGTGNASARKHREPPSCFSSTSQSSLRPRVPDTRLAQSSMALRGDTWQASDGTRAG